MSAVSISYKSLKNASEEATTVARKLEQYASSLDNDVCRKLNRYRGTWTANLASALSNTNAKISELRSEKGRYERYAANLTGLREKCDEVDKAVKSRVSSLTARFKETHGIRNSKIENAINNVVTTLGNSTAVGRWLTNKIDQRESREKYLKDSIKEWYNYEGGKELIKGSIVSGLEIALGVLAVAGAILSGGTIVLIAGVIGGVIMAANGIANYINETKAYTATRNGDPATGRRRSKINTWQDYLRSSFIFGDSGENYHYNKAYNNWATVIDIVKTTCDIITFAGGMGTLLKNIGKWATGSTANVKNMSLWKDVFTKKTFMAFKSKITNIGTAFKNGGWKYVKDVTKQRFTWDIIKDNLKGEFFDFYKKDSQMNVKGTVDSVKNILSIPKDLLDEDSNALIVGIKNVALPGLTAFNVKNVDEGRVKLDSITLDKFTSPFEKGAKSITSIKKIVSRDSIVNVRVMDKLMTPSKISCAIPHILIPKIEMPVLRAA